MFDVLDTKRRSHIETKNLFNFIYKNDMVILISEDKLGTIFYFVKNKKAALSFFKGFQKSRVVSSFGDGVVEKYIELALR